MVEGLNDEKATSNQYRCAVPRALRVTGYGSILGSRWSIYRGISWPRILPRIRNASVYLVNFSGLRRLARSWWGTCARSPCWTKKRAVAMKKALLTSIAALFLATGAAHATGPDNCAVVVKTRDGFLNVRAAPTMKSKIVARINPADIVHDDAYEDTILE